MIRRLLPLSMLALVALAPAAGASGTYNGEPLPDQPVYSVTLDGFTFETDAQHAFLAPPDAVVSLVREAAVAHVEEQDGCDHGATGKPCRSDPQPGHGAECLVHGQHGGVNEDHCEGSPTSTTTTTSEPTTTTTITPPSTASPTTTSTASPSTSTPTAPSTVSTSSTPASPGGQLPRTGANGDLLLVGLVFVVLGAALRLVTKWS